MSSSVLRRLNCEPRAAGLAEIRREFPAASPAHRVPGVFDVTVDAPSSLSRGRAPRATGEVIRLLRAAGA
jgi:hypothetical protein